jgi:hypothetical protein
MRRHCTAYYKAYKPYPTDTSLYLPYTYSPTYLLTYGLAH